MATILIIDDTPINLGVMVGHLEAQGYRVLVAQDGEEGLQRAELMRPDVILLDVMMPGPSGFEVCRRLKSRSSTREIPVIFMTSLTDTRDKVAGFAAGAVDYVTKPLQADEVMARVDTHLKLRTAQSQLEAQNDMLAVYREDLEEQMAENAAALQESQRRLQACDDLLAYARVGQAELRLQAVALEPLLRRLTDALAARMAAAGATLEVRRPLAVPRADPTLLAEILTNLLDYALTSRRPDVPLSVSVSATVEDGRVLLRVSDNGGGIAAESRARMFEVFERSGGGAERADNNIGLAIVAKAARLMGGEVGVDSSPGEGSTFSIRLLAAPAVS